jgi:ankyrin repeat protein
MRILVDHGAQVNARTRTGETPLHFAAYWGHLNIVNFLLDMEELDTTARDSRGRTAADLAFDCGRRNVAAVIQRKVRGRAVLK